MSVTPSPIGGFAAQFFDNNGVILSGGKIYTYAAGTTTPQITYTSAAGVTAHANPIILDSAGRVPGGEIWLTDGLVYKFVIETATSILLGTYDNITGVNSNFVNYTAQEEVQTATAGQTVFTLTTMNYAPGTNSLSVYIDGVNQYVGDSYLETDSSTVTFTSGVHVGGEVKFTTTVQTTTGAVDASIVSFTGFKGQTGSVQDLAGNDGSDWIGFDQAGTGAVARSAQDKMRDVVSAKDFGAVGDGVADDTAAIQAALDYVGSNGGGTVYLPMTSATGRYRTTSVLRIPSYVTLEGTNPLVFPFDYNNGIIADFVDPMQWVIEAKTTSGGVPVPYNTILTSNLLGIGGTFNCGVRNLRIANVNTTPYGGVRMHASFGPIIENVAVAGVGCGFLVNESLGGRWAVNARTLYYGMAVWNNANANEISLYTTQSPTATNVPSGYQLPFMTALNGQLTTTYQLPSNTPYQYSTGLIIGADSGMTTQTSTICATIETFANSVLMLNTKSANFTNLYIEGNTNDVKYAVTAAKSTFNIMGCHAYMDGTGDLLAIGNETQSILNFNGIPFYASFGSVNTNQTKLIVYGLDNPTPSTPALNVQFASQNTPWIAPTFQNGWTNVGGVNATAAYRKNQYTGNVELKGFLSAGALNVAAFTLPVGYRPLEKRNFGVFGGYVAVQTDGEVQPDATNISLDGIFFKAEQ